MRTAGATGAVGFETAQYAEMIREMVALNDETTNMKGVLKRYVEAALDPRRLLEPVPAPPPLWAED
ncbi:MAG: hypothetical protein P0119_09875 [Nitrospira sp.]|nr:hypothetical protein [Nitrospira sp.]